MGYMANVARGFVWHMLIACISVWKQYKQMDASDRGQPKLSYATYPQNLFKKNESHETGLFVGCLYASGKIKLMV